MDACGLSVIAKRQRDKKYKGWEDMDSHDHPHPEWAQRIDEDRQDR